MANKGKFIDRNPTLRAAGTIIEPDCNVGDSLKFYSKEEAAANVMKIKCRKQTQDFSENSNARVSPFLPEDYVKDLLSPESKKTRFIAFREKFSEDMFFKKPELGKVFPLESKPERFTNESFTYGQPSRISEKVYELILPKKSAEEINRDYTKWHDKYIKSHNHYFPAEKIKRPYNDKFNPNSTFGIRTSADTTGRMVKQCLQQCDRLMVISKPQKDFIERTTGPVGSSKWPAIRVEKHPNFGKNVNSDECDVHALVENIEPCKRKNDFIESVSHINKLRRTLFNRIDFHMYDLKTALQKFDKESSGYISFESILKALRSLIIRANENKIRLAMSYYKIFDNEGQPNERVNIDKFWKMLHIQHPLPRIGNLASVPENFLNQDTTYITFCQDRMKSLEYHPLLELTHKHTDADRTRAVDVISPDIPMYYGLAPSDFELLRTKEELRRIFKGVLTDNFDQIWELARGQLKGDANCKMCVNYLRAAMNSN